MNRVHCVVFAVPVGLVIQLLFAFVSISGLCDVCVGRGSLYVACLVSDSWLDSVVTTGRQLGVCVLIIMHDRSRMTIDPRIPTMPGRSTSGFH